MEKARNHNISLISICDHNSIDVYKEIESLPGTEAMKIILGTEITSIMDDIEYHVLAYGFDMQNKAFNDLLQYNRNVNINMGNGLIKNIATDYPNISSMDFQNYKRNPKNGGWDSIDYLKSKGLVANWSDYTGLSRKYAAPLENDFLSTAEVIKIIHNAGGYAILAHLCHYVKPCIADYEKKAKLFHNMGIDGFEVYYPQSPTDLTDYLVRFCNEHGLAITAGSDDHGGFIGAPEDKYYIGAVQVEIGQLNLPFIPEE